MRRLLTDAWRHGSTPLIPRDRLPGLRGLGYPLIRVQRGIQIQGLRFRRHVPSGEILACSGARGRPSGLEPWMSKGSSLRGAQGRGDIYGNSYPGSGSAVRQAPVKSQGLLGPSGTGLCPPALGETIQSAGQVGAWLRSKQSRLAVLRGRSPAFRRGRGMVAEPGQVVLGLRMPPLRAQTAGPPRRSSWPRIRPAARSGPRRTPPLWRSETRASLSADGGGCPPSAG